MFYKTQLCIYSFIILLVSMINVASSADIISPLPNEVFQENDQVVIQVDEFEATSVEAFIDGVSVGGCPQVGAVFECVWVATVGAHEITAITVVPAPPVTVTVVVEPPPPPSGPGLDALDPYIGLPGEWVNIPDSMINSLWPTVSEFGTEMCNDIDCGGAGSMVAAWTGWAIDGEYCFWSIAGGGHADYGGNGSYRYCLTDPITQSDGTGGWQRIIAPMPLTRVGENDSNCPEPTLGPAARHTYDGPVYNPENNTIFYDGLSGYCKNGFGGSAQAWEFDIDNALSGIDPWTQLTLNRDPVTGETIGVETHYPRNEIDPLTGNIIHSFRGKTRLLDPLTYDVVESSGNGQDLRAGNSVFDPVRRRWFLGNSGSLWYVDVPETGVPGFRTLLVDYGNNPDFNVMDGGDHKGLAMRNGFLWIWKADGKIHKVDPDLLTVESFVGGPSDVQEKVYSRFQYIIEKDIFVGYMLRSGWWIYNPFEEGSPGPIPDPVGAGPSSDTSFADLCIQSNTVLCDPLDDTPIQGRAITADTSCQTITEATHTPLAVPVPQPQASLDCRWWHWRSVWPSKTTDPAAVRPKVNPDEGNGGALEFTRLPNSSSGSVGIYHVNASPDASEVFGPGTAMRLRFKIKINCDLLYTDCDPSSSTYQTERRSFEMKNSLKETSMKIFGLGEHDRPPTGTLPLDHLNTCDGFGGITHTGFGSQGFWSAYTSCVWFKGISAQGPKVNGIRIWDVQPGGDNVCWLNSPANDVPNEGDFGGTRIADGWPDCEFLEPDEWITVQVDVEYGGCTSDSSDPAQRTKYKLWIAKEGQPFRLIFDTSLNTRCPANYDNDAAGFGKLWITPQMTKLDPDQIYPEGWLGKVWYDDLWIAELPYSGPDPATTEVDTWIEWSGGVHKTPYP